MQPICHHFSCSQKYTRFCYYPLKDELSPETPSSNALVDDALDEIYHMDLSSKLTKKCEKKGICVACDKKLFRVIPGVDQVFGDVTEEHTLRQILTHLRGRSFFDLVVSVQGYIFHILPTSVM